MNQTDLRLADLRLAFRVSLDEEYVSLTGTLAQPNGSARPVVFDFKSRAHHYTLLTLARLREQESRDESIPASSHGWVTTPELLQQLGANETKLPVEVCRIRQQFSKAGFVDAADIVERRRGTGQLRIGTDQFLVERV